MERVGKDFLKQDINLVVKSKICEVLKAKKLTDYKSTIIPFDA